jgi:CRISPR system Cascade subunit CasC
MSQRIEFHVLQSFAPSNLNRDDTGSPKDAIFGGVRRSRISSQCLKRAIRTHARSSGLVPDEAASHRTKRVTDLIARELHAKHGVAHDRGVAIAEKVVAGIGSQKKMKLKDGKTDYLMFLGGGEVSRMAAIIAERLPALEAGKAKDVGEAADLATRVLIERRGGGRDVAMFGRMLANLPDGNVDAACQVAHALSTHRVDRDFDYFTAVDDLKPDDTAAADMIGTIEFNSATYYRYSVIDVHALQRNLASDAASAAAVLDAIEGYTRAVIEAAPTGKQNSFAAHNPPSVVLITIRDRQAPRSLANAFERPVTSQAGGYLQTSAERLKEEWLRTDDAFGTAKAAFVLDLTGAFTESPATRLANVDALVAAVRNAAST